MNACDLLLAAGRNVKQTHLDWAEAQGISRRALIDAGLFGVAGVRFESGGFEFDDAGPQAVISPVLEDRDRGPLVGTAPATVDLVAWLPKRPAIFARYYGRALFLGDPTAFDPLPVWSTPLSWLQNGCAGVVVLDRPSAWAEFASFGVPVLAESVAHGRDLRRLLSPPKTVVEILVPRSEAA